MTATGSTRSLAYADGHRIEWREEDEWALKQALASPSRFYGDGGTIHRTTTLDVETDETGQVVAVWYRCQMLPFTQITVDLERVKEMRSLYDLPEITGVEVRDPKETF